MRTFSHLSRARPLAGAALALCLFATVPLRADEGGLALMVLSVPKDSASQRAAATGAFLARGAFARNPRYQLLDLETFLDQIDESPGKEPIIKALASLEKGSHALDENELDTAISALNEAVVGFERAAAYVEDTKPYVEALLKLGAAHAVNADSKAALAAFKRALVIDRAAALANLPPQGQKAFEAAGKEVDEGERFSLSVFSTPAAAEVYVDGVFRGATPQVVDALPRGPHLVRVYRPGYRATGRVYKVTSSDDTAQYTLKPTLRTAELENITARIHQDVVAGQGPVLQELVKFAKVDQVFVMSVVSSATDVRVSAALVDSTGATLGQGERTFTGDRYRQEMDGWIEGGFRTAQGGTDKAVQKDVDTRTSSNYAAPSGGGGGGSPGRGKIIAGILLIPVLPCAMLLSTCGMSIDALVWWIWATFPIPLVGPGGLFWFNLSQRDRNLRVLSAIFGFILPIPAVICTVLGVAALVGGIALIVWGINEQRSWDDVMAGGGGDAPLPNSPTRTRVMALEEEN